MEVSFAAGDCVVIQPLIRISVQSNYFFIVTEPAYFRRFFSISAAKHRCHNEWIFGVQAACNEARFMK
jgi:hypothetical protein